ncbi:MAG: penicillin-binding transpeptidase domain-containing protein, partial [Verrucomicrobiales bacterium]
FRPADGGNAEPRTRQNLAVSATYEPGSTFKIITHGAAIDQGLVGLDNRVSCHNGYYIEDGWKAALRDASEGRESASVRDVIAFSLNTGTFMVAQQMKSASFYNYMASFGFGQKTGIRMPAEAKGTLPNPNNGPRSNDGWGNSRPKLSRVAMGYTMSATPLQILSTMSVVCNQGDLIKPRIVREILTENY